MGGFDLDKTVEYWRAGARYDLGVASALLKARKYPYAPFTHSLLTLAQKARLELPTGYQDKLSEIMEFHLQGRYPDDPSGFYKKCTLRYATTYLESIRRVYRWLNDQLRRS